MLQLLESVFDSARNRKHPVTAALRW